MKLPLPVRIFLTLSIVLDSLCLAVMEVQKYVFHRGFPYSSQFVSPPRFYDLTSFTARFQHFHQLDFFSQAPSFGEHFLYPAPDALLYEIFYASGWHIIRLFFLITIPLLAVLGVMLGREMVRRGVGLGIAALFLSLAALLSYPFWIEYALGNMEIFIFLMVAFGVVAFLHDRLILSAVLIGIAASMKIFPFVYLALFVTRKRYKEVGLGIAVAAIVDLVSLWLLCPSLSVSYHGVKAGLTEFEYRYILQFHAMETGFDHSLFGFMKSLLHHFVGSILSKRLLTAYMAFASVAGLALYFLRIRFLPILNQILCLCVASILLPPTSHDYTLIHLYVPWGLMVLYAIGEARVGRKTDGLVAAFVCLAILMSAESELVYRSLGHSGQLKAVVLVVLMYIGLKYRFGSTESPDVRVAVQV
jgi:hypothetical protein